MEALELLNQMRDVSAQSINIGDYLIDVTKKLDRAVGICSFNSVPLFTLGNISTITGKAKSRKTFLASSIAASVISGECLGIKSENKGLVLYLDTEQSEYDVQRVAKRTLRLAALSPDENYPDLVMYALRSLSVEERIKMLEATVEKHKPLFVIIDGIRDLLHDFNNIAESASLVGLIMKLSTENNCHIVSILHQNKGDGNMRGHAGSELLNKSETVLEVSTSNDITTVKAIASRGMSPNDIYFKVTTSGLPMQCNPPLKDDAKLYRAMAIIKKCLGQTSMTHKKLLEEYSEKAGCSESSSKRSIADMLRENIIEKDDQGLYRITRQISSPNTNESSIDDFEDLPY